MTGANRGTSGALLQQLSRKGTDMLGFVAVLLFIIGFIINAANVATSSLFDPMSFLLVGLACLALHLSGVGTGWKVRR
jgi:hypothetical protein